MCTGNETVQGRRGFRRGALTPFGRRLGGLFVLMVSLTWLTACAHRPASTSAPASGETDDPAPAAAETYALDTEGDAPPPADVEFEEDALTVPPEDVESAALTQSPVQPQPAADLPPPDERAAPSVETPQPPSVQTPVPPSEAAGQRGFRVQLVAAGSHADAERIAREARGRLPVPVYVEFETPFYKVRAGDFTDRAQALVLRDRARENGYPEAWVVTTTVKSPAEG